MGNKLFIIGNGFDLFHGIPSSYDNFRTYLQNRTDTYDFLEPMEEYIGCDYLWSDFESALAELDVDYLTMSNDTYLTLDEDEDVDDGVYEIEEALAFADVIPSYLRDWVNELDINIAMKPLKTVLTNDDLYLTFNYTDTLQNVYGIPDGQITHIHGKIASERQLLIVGHGNVRILEDEWIYDIYESKAEVVGRLVSDYFRTTYKDVPKIIEQHSVLWDKLSDITEIFVLGHSLSTIDIPYFEHIQNIVKGNNCKWHISYHREDEQYDFPRALQNIGVPLQNIQLLTMEQLYKKRW